MASKIVRKLVYHNRIDKCVVKKVKLDLALLKIVLSNHHWQIFTCSEKGSGDKGIRMSINSSQITVSSAIVNISLVLKVVNEAKIHQSFCSSKRSQALTISLGKIA